MNWGSEAGHIPMPPARPRHKWLRPKWVMAHFQKERFRPHSINRDRTLLPCGSPSGTVCSSTTDRTCLFPAEAALSFRASKPTFGYNQEVQRPGNHSAFHHCRIHNPNLDRLPEEPAASSCVQRMTCRNPFAWRSKTLTGGMVRKSCSPVKSILTGQFALCLKTGFVKTRHLRMALTLRTATSREARFLQNAVLTTPETPSSWAAMIG